MRSLVLPLLLCASPGWGEEWRPADVAVQPSPPLPHSSPTLLTPQQASSPQGRFPSQRSRSGWLQSKLVNEWSGSAPDFLAGSAFGAITGFAASKLLRSALLASYAGLTMLAPTMLRATMVGAGAWVLERCEMITINRERLAGPVEKLGALSRRLCEKIGVRSVNDLRPSEVFSALKRRAENNLHAAAGCVVGVVLGVAKSLLASTPAAMEARKPVQGSSDWLHTALVVGKGAVVGARSGAMSAWHERN